MVNSRQKGKRIELEACRVFRSLGIPAQRTVQFQGRGSSGDIVIPWTNLHLEAKGRRAIVFHRWYDQAVADARHGSLPLVISHEDRGDWLATMRVAHVGQVAEQLLHAAACWAREQGQG